MITFKQYLLERNFLLPLLAGGAMLTAAIGGAGQPQAPKKPQVQQAQAAPQQAVSVNTIPQQAVDTIVGFEQCHLKGYRCPSGVPTIGYGNTHYSTGKPVKETDTITKEQLQNYNRKRNRFPITFCSGFSPGTPVSTAIGL